MKKDELQKDAPPQKGKWLSRLFLLAAAVLLIYVCSVCCPTLTARVKTLLGKTKESRAVQAFSSLTGSLRAGDGVVQAFSESYEVLTGNGA